MQAVVGWEGGGAVGRAVVSKKARTSPGAPREQGWDVYIPQHRVYQAQSRAQKYLGN